MTIGFTWKRGIEKNLAKKLYRMERQLLQRHPDCLLKMPQEVKDAVQQKKIPQRCVDKIVKEHEVRLKRVAQPTVIRPKRMNRYG